MGDSTAAGDSLAATLMVFMIVEVAVGAFMLYLTGRILRKAGFSGWWALAMLVPLVNLVMFIAFAFVEWPVQAQARLARSRTGSPRASGSRFAVPQEYPQPYSVPQQFPQQYPQPYSQPPAPPVGEFSQQSPHIAPPMSPKVPPPRYPETGTGPAMGAPSPQARPAGGMPIDPTWHGPAPS